MLEDGLAVAPDSLATENVISDLRDSAFVFFLSELIHNQHRNWLSTPFSTGRSTAV